MIKGKSVEILSLIKNVSDLTTENKLIHDNKNNKCMLNSIIDVNQLKEQYIEIESFAHTVAHDLNSILSEIVNYAEILVDDTDIDAKTRCEYLNIISTNGRKMSSVMRELLLLANINNRGINYHDIDNHHIINQTIKRLSQLIKEKKAKIIIPNYFIPCVSYGPWIEEIWLNYISNAIKYGGDPCIVEIDSVKVDNYVKFWVKDNGIGLTKNQQSEIFKLQNNQTIEYNIIKGNGIGLSIVSRIVKKLNGFAKVESSDSGSIFSFYLPIK